MNYQNSRFMCSVASAVVAGFLASPVVAQESVKAASADEIIVTGERVNRSTRDIISSVSVLTESDVRNRGQNSVYEALNGVPNILQVNGQGLPVIRGQNGTGSGTLEGPVFDGVDARTVLVIDDVARAPTWANVAYTTMWDIEQIEVFRGPQSTLRGKNAIAGAVILKAADPTYDFQGSVLSELSYTDVADLGYRVAGMISGPLITDKLAARFTVERREFDDQIAGLFNEAEPRTFKKSRKIETTRLRGKLLWEPNGQGGVRVDLQGEYIDGTLPLLRNFVAGPGSGGGRPFSDRLYEDGDYRVIDAESWLVAGRAGVPLGGGKIELISSYGRDTYTANLERNRSGIVFLPSKDDIHTTELLYSFGSADSTVSGLFGLSYNYRKNVTRAEAFGSLLDTTTATDTYGAYADIRVRPTERLQVIAGGRLQYLKQDRDFSFFGSTAIGTIKDTRLLPQLGLLYEVADRQTIGASIRRGYNAGGIAANLSAGRSYTFEAETVWTGEVSYKAALGSGINVAATGFYNDFKGQQFDILRDLTDPFSSEIINVPTTYSWGIELEVSAKLTETLLLRTGGGFLRTGVTESIDTNESIEGNRWGLDPKFNGNISLNWDATDRLAFDGRASYVGPYSGDVLNNPDFTGGDYFVLDAGVTFRAGPASIRFYVQNITDTVPFITKIGNSFGSAGAPRTFGLSVRGDF